MMTTNGEQVSVGKRDGVKYMVIERIRPGKLDAVYGRLRSHGRCLPEGLRYIDSWLEVSGDRCFQLMETRNRSLFGDWIAWWCDLLEFEIIPLGSKPVNPDTTPELH